jgi:hypothetical protein
MGSRPRVVFKGFCYPNTEEILARRPNPEPPRLVRDRSKVAKLGPNAELVVGDLDDPASLKPAFASVDEAFVVMNGKDLNRLEVNALDRSSAFKRLRLRWPQRERGVAEDVRASILGKRSREYMCLSGKGAFISAACRMERARGSRAELPQ